MLVAGTKLKKWHITNAQILLQVVVVKDLVMAKNFRLTTLTLCLIQSKEILQDMKKKVLHLGEVAAAMIAVVHQCLAALLLTLVRLIPAVRQVVILADLVAVIQVVVVQVGIGKNL